MSFSKNRKSQPKYCRLSSHKSGQFLVMSDNMVSPKAVVYIGILEALSLNILLKWIWIIEYVTCIYRYKLVLASLVLETSHIMHCHFFLPEILLLSAAEASGSSRKGEQDLALRKELPLGGQTVDLRSAGFGSRVLGSNVLKAHPFELTCWRANSLWSISHSPFHSMPNVFILQIYWMWSTMKIYDVWEGSTLIFEFSRLNIDNLILPPPLPNMRIFGGTRKTCCCLVYMPICETSPLRY